MNYFVTGGTGFIGAYLVRDLLQDGHNVTVYDLSPNREHLEDVAGEAASGVEIVGGDVTDLPLLLRTMQRAAPQRVVHLAATLGAGSDQNPMRTLKINCEGTLNVWEAALATGVEKVVWASSIAVFGPTDEREKPIRNDADHRPARLYGACKSLIERFGEHYRETRGLDGVGLRFTVVYGYGKALTVPRGSGGDYLLQIIDRPALGEPAVVPHGDGNVDLLYVEDAARALVLASETPKNPSIGLTICGANTTFRDAASVVQRLLPAADIKVLPGLRSGRGGSGGYDGSTTLDEIGYSPDFSLEEGLRRNIDMLRAKHGLMPIG